jgi:hypothetical protein
VTTEVYIRSRNSRGRAKNPGILAMLFSMVPF